MASVTLRTKPIEKKGYSLFLDIYNEGQRYKEYLKLYVSKDYTKPENKNVLREDKDSWELANAVHAKRLLAIKESASGFIPKSSKQDFIKYFKEQAAIKGHSPYQLALRHLLIFNGRDTLTFKQLNEIYLKEFIAYLKSTDLSVTSIRLYLTMINVVLNIAVSEKIIQVNPFKYIKKGKNGDIPPKQQKKIEYLSLEELKQMNECEYRSEIKQYFFFCCFTGLRESDLNKLKWSDIKNGTLTYTQKKQQNAKPHYLPLGKKALEILEEIKESQKKLSDENHENVFAHLPKERAMGWNLKRWAKKAEIEKNIHIHVGRHTFATLALTNGVSLYTVSKMLGHSSIAITQVYAEVIDDVKQQAAELMPTF